MESEKCSCKGIRICKICEFSKTNLVENKININHEIINLNDLIIKENIISHQKLKELFSPEMIKFKILSNGNNTNHLIRDNKNQINERIEREKIYLENLVNSMEENFNQNKHGGCEIFDGFYLIKKFLNENEHDDLIDKINQYEWNASQSGRKKQDYGPKINYKKRKIKFEELNLEFNIDKKVIIKNEISIDEEKIKKYYDFQFPYFSPEKCSFHDFISSKLKNIDFLKDYKIAEIGNLFYDYSRGGHIDPHIDDIWIWGKRILGINLMSDTVMTFTRELEIEYYGSFKRICFEVEFPLDKGDLYIISDFSRYLWKHSVKKHNIKSDRMVVTLREFEENFLKNYFIDFI